MSKIDLESKFPEMRPIRRSPALFRINGCGLALYGSRDHDEETGTYVKSHCVCLIFVPVLAVGAYRVANAPNGGWYILGREPLSALAKLGNLLVLAAVCVVGGLGYWDARTKSPGYVAAQKLAEADRLAQAKQFSQAAQLYGSVATGPTEHAGAAGERLKNLVNGPIDQAPLNEAAAVLKVAQTVQKRGLGRLSSQEIYQRGLALLTKQAGADPRNALTMIDTIAPIAPPDDQALDPIRLNVLERLVAQEPDNVDRVSGLAMVYEKKGDLDRCKTLLTPLRAKLGLSEGARILGHIDTREGNVESANALLVPYTEGRLKKLHDAEQALESTVTSAQSRVIEQLKNGTAGDFAFQAYKDAAEPEKQTMLRQYLDGKLRNDPGIESAQEALMREAKVVPVALDLGIVQLQRAQTMTDPKARRDELEKAEKTFLAVHRIAGESDAFRLNLGQVDYWLGKHAEGRKLFDESIEAQQRSSKILLTVASILREVGSVSEARPLVEEVYNKETNPERKAEAAVQRALLDDDVDTQVLWYRRADSKNPGIRAMLNESLARKAMKEGREHEAVGFLRQAIDDYQSQPETVGTLNNLSLAYIELFYLNGDRTAYRNGVERLEKAIALDPRNSVLVGNAASLILRTSLREIIGDAIDFRTLKSDGSLDLLSYLYRDRAGKDRFVERLRTHPEFGRAVSLYEKTLLLAPKRADAYESLTEIDSFRGDLDGLRNLVERLEKVELDLKEENAKTLDLYTGKRLDETRRDLSGSLARVESRWEEVRKRAKRDATYAITASSLALHKLSGDPLGLPVDPDEVVQLSEDAHAASPSVSTAFGLIRALLFRAHRSLMGQVPSYAARTEKWRRLLDHRHLLALAVTHDESTRSTALANSDFQRALTMLQEFTATFPEEVGSWAWLVLETKDPKPEAGAARAALGEEKRRLHRQIDLRLHPVSAAMALDAFWALRLTDRPDEAAAILKQFADRGVPFPDNPGQDTAESK